MSNARYATNNNRLRFLQLGYVAFKVGGSSLHIVFQVWCNNSEIESNADMRSKLFICILNEVKYTSGLSHCVVYLGRKTQ